MMSGLREALEELRAEVAVLHDDAGLESSDQSAGEFHAYKRMMNRLNELLAAHPVEPAPMAADVARNIVNQLGDLWHVPVDVRQASNDLADEFVTRLICASPVRGIAEGGGITDDECWLCGGTGGIALHNKWSEQRGKPLWTAHEHPSEDSHPTYPCPACAPPLGLQQVPTGEEIASVLHGHAHDYAHSRCPGSDECPLWFASVSAAGRVLAPFGKPVESAACICHMIVDTYPDPHCPQYSEHVKPAEEGCVCLHDESGTEVSALCAVHNPRKPAEDTGAES